MQHCRHYEEPIPQSDEDDEDDEGDDGKSSAHVQNKKKARRGLDIAIRFFDAFSRTMDAVKRSLDAIKENYRQQDEAVNFGVGYVEDKKLTHGISTGGVTSGIYGGRDLLYNPRTEEYLVCTKSGSILKFDWTGAKQGLVTTSKRFTRFIHIECTGMYICYNPGRTYYYLYREDWTLALDTVSIMPIDKIIANGRKSEESNFDFFILSGCSVNRYSYNPANNLVVLQDSLKISDIEADNAEIEKTCFDEPVEDKKQWIYLTYKKNCSIIDITGRVLGSKKNLHVNKITAIVAYGPSEFVVTGDEKGILKIWGQRWQFITEVAPHNDRVTHLVEHPNGRAVVSFAPDKQLFAFSLDTQKKLESMKTPEIVEHLAINKARKAFMALGPRKLTILKMDVLFFPFSPMSSPVAFGDFTWNPNIPKRAVVVSTDNAIRVINPVTGRILKSVLVNPPKPTLNGLVYAPQFETMYVLKTSPEDVNSLCVQIYDCTLNPCKYKDTWEENKWDAGVTAMALYDFHPSIVVPEKTLTFATSKKKEEETVHYETASTFLICGLRDGCVCCLNLQTGDCEYKTSCHKGQVNKIEVNYELNQFVSLGAEPSIRIWKVSLHTDDTFIPLFDISWKYAIKQVAVVRDVISFALSHHDSPTHKVVFFNTTETERYDHRNYFCHQKEIICLSACRELLLFMSASNDETIRIWNEKAELVRILILNWKPNWAAFGTSQGDIFIGIENKLQVIPANKFLSVIYRNRALMSGLNAGGQEFPTPLNATRSSQDPRMYVVLEEEEMYETKQRELEKQREKEKKMVPRTSKDKGKKQEIFLMEEKIPKIDVYSEPKDSQRAKDLEKYRLLEEDLNQIVEGNHNFSIYVPDFKKMSKKSLDEYGQTIFPEDGDKRKMFASESRVAAKIAMDQNSKQISATDDYTI